MEELINTISEKTGITVDQAKGAVETVISHLKDKLPAGLGDKIESFIQGGSSETGDLMSGLKEKISSWL